MREARLQQGLRATANGSSGRLERREDIAAFEPNDRELMRGSLSTREVPWRQVSTATTLSVAGARTNRRTKVRPHGWCRTSASVQFALELLVENAEQANDSGAVRTHFRAGTLQASRLTLSTEDP